MAQQQPIYNPPIPYLGLIPGGLQPGKMITVDGFVPHHAQRFAINIQCGPGVNPRDDIAFHVNMRFPEMCIVRNHLQGMSWGIEDCGGGMPLTVGSNFQIIILCEQNAYKLAVNGSHFCEFPHRIAFTRASHITIDGDVTVSLMQFQGGNPNYQANNWGSPTQTAGAPPQMGMPMPAMGGPPPYGPPPPYNEQTFQQNPAALSYNPQPQGGYQPYSQPPGGFQSQMPYNPGSAYNPNMPSSDQYHKSSSSTGAKILKYGLPLAGVGLGAYALGGGFSRCSSSSSDDDWLG